MLCLQNLQVGCLNALQDQVAYSVWAEGMEGVVV